MGWCSGTEIMDTALAAADELMERTYEALGVDPDRVTLDEIRPELNNALRPFVTKLAQHLRDNDWDCIEEALYFNRFAQEMLGLDDYQYEAYLVDRLQYAGDIDIRKELVRKLHDLHTKAGNNVTG